MYGRRAGIPHMVIPARILYLLLTTTKGVPYSCSQAGIAQLVEHKLPKLGVAGSNPVARSKKIMR
jgi:hypothetical protein